MSYKETDSNLDEIKNRIKDSYETAMYSLKENSDKLSEEFHNFEEKLPDSYKDAKKKVAGAVNKLMEDSHISISLKEEEMVKIPVAGGALLLFLGIRRPKILLGSLLGMYISGMDLTLKIKDKEYSLRKTIEDGREHLVDNMEKTRSEIGNKLYDLKDVNFKKDGKSGDKYFVVKL